MLGVVRRVGWSAVVAAGRRCRPSRARSSQPVFTWITSGDFNVGVHAAARSAVGGDDPGRHRHRLADPHLLDRLHARGERRRVRALLLVPEPVRRVHAGARARLELPGDVRRLGGRRPLLVPADRLLVSEEVGVRRRQEGVHRQPHRRLRVHPRRAARCSCASARSTSRRSRAPSSALSPETTFGTRVADHAAAVRRRDRQVGADSALRLAAGRDGRPDAGLRADPRGDDGDGGRVHDRPQRRAVQPRAADADDRRGRSARRRR